MIFKWLKNMAVAIDQLANAFAGGNPDVTISARTGFNANLNSDTTFIYYWKLMEYIINFAFYPLDGPDHCLQSYQNDPDEHHQSGSDFVRAVLGVIIIVSCSCIGIILWLLSFVIKMPEGRKV